MSFLRALPLATSVLFLFPSLAAAATFTVGPGKQYAQLSSVFSSNNLAPGDIVLVDGGVSYSGGITVQGDDGGTAANPVVIRWNRSVGSTRPLLQGGQHTIKFEQSNNVVFEGFEVTGGSTTCIFSEADNVTVRDSLIRDCPSHGILGADQNSGSFTLEYSEIRNSGFGTTRHSIYMQSDEVSFPGAVFRMRYNYVHSATGGVLVRVRHERALIYYNWIENSVYGEMELIGPDCDTQKAGWTPGLKREDADIVGNVIVHTNSWRNAIRAGGDLDGRSQGRLRLVNNTIIFDRSGPANAVMVQLGAGSVEMHNNVVYQTAAGSTPAIIRENPATDVGNPDACEPQSKEPWADGRKVFGTNNWVQTGAQLIPVEFTGTRQGANPLLANIAARSLRPAAGSPLIDAANPNPPAPPAFPFPSPQLLPAYDPPVRAKMAIGDEHARLPLASRYDIGAFEQFDIDDVIQRIRVHGAQPRVPGRAAAAASDEGVSPAQPRTRAQPDESTREGYRQSPRTRVRPRPARER